MVTAGAVEIVTIAGDVGAASVAAGVAATVDDSVAGVIAVDVVAVVAAAVFRSGATTVVAVVVVEVLMVTCCDTISEDPSVARLAASLAAAGDIK